MTGPAAVRWSTRGQSRAVAIVERMISGVTPHAILLAGPPSVGKTTLAGDIAAGLLCQVAPASARPCRTCRSCRLVAGGNHPDLHRIVPEGPGGMVIVGDRDDPKRPRGVRDLIHDLSLLPVEGAARVAVVEGASQMNEDAQNALLKTLEEPPAGVTIVLCVDEEELLLPTVRSRCARIRLGPVGVREIEALLGECQLADPATAARLARVSEGRPGVAVAYARAPAAITLRTEIARSLLDLPGSGRAAALSGGRDLLERSGELAEVLAGPSAAATPLPIRRRTAGGRASGGGASGGEASGSRAGVLTGAPAAHAPNEGEAAAGVAAGTEATEAVDVAASEAGEDPRRQSAVERRRAARMLLAIWRDVARDLALVAGGSIRALRDPGLLEDLQATAATLPGSTAAAIPTAFLGRLDEVAMMLAGNVSPELAVDVLALAWRGSSSSVS